MVIKDHHRFSDTTSKKNKGAWWATIHRVAKSQTRLKPHTKKKGGLLSHPGNLTGSLNALAVEYNTKDTVPNSRQGLTSQLPLPVSLNSLLKPSFHAMRKPK